MSNSDTNRPKVQRVHEMKKALYRGFFTQTQAAEVVNFYEQSRDLAAMEKAKTEKELQGINPKRERQQYNETRNRLSFYSRYPWYLRENAFLMLFSLIEELLTSSYEVCTEIDIESDGGGIHRFKRPYRDRGVLLTSISRWEFLTKCQMVRNALLHANGNITLCNNNNDIYEMLSTEKWSAFFGKRQGLLRITKEKEDRSIYLEIKEVGINELLQAFYDLEELLLGPSKE